MPLIHIDSLDDPRLEAYRNLKWTNRTKELGTMVAESVRVVRRLIESDCEVLSLLLSDRKVEKFRDWLPEDVPVYVVDHDQADQLIGFDFHSGVLGCGLRPAAPDLDELLATATGPITLIACQHVTDPANVGVITRLASGFGVLAMLTGEGTADPFSRRALRVSMATALTLPILISEDLPAEFERLKHQHGFTIVGTVLDEPAIPLAEATRPDRLVLLFGNEAHGLDDRLVALCDQSWTIPMPGISDSINVAVAAGIFLYELNRTGESRR